MKNLRKKLEAGVLLCLMILFLFGCAKEEQWKPPPGLRARRAKRAKERQKEVVRGPAVVISKEAEHAIRITTGDYYDGCPCWSPDGKKIAYCSYREGNQNIWIIELSIGEEGELAASGEPRQVTTGTFVDQEPCWLPDGEGIIFSSNRRGEYGLFLVKLKDNSITDLEQNGIQPRCSPQGDKVVFIDMNNIWTMELDEGRSKQFLTVSGYNEYPCWSADAKKLIFSSSGDLISIGEEAGSEVPLTSSAWNNEPDWSVERDEVVFVSNRGGHYDLWKTKPDGSDPVQLTDGPLRETSPRWSPDGNWIAFQSNYEGSYDIWVISVKQSPPKE